MKRYIVSHPEILGGTPCIVGTRVPLSRVVFLLREGYTLDAIHSEYPHIEFTVLSGAVDELIESIEHTVHAPQAI
ncbi:DUF433 domain-containing protein [Candidatus Gottesmanbacteria bacterium]|nr:DUF433 domain-containing protein [Candidatus Gottesmanbacteria bacterium]